MAKPLSKKTFFFTKVIFFLPLIFVSCSSVQEEKEVQEEVIIKDTIVIQNVVEHPDYVKKLEKNYGHHFSVISEDIIIWSNGDTIYLDDKKEKSIDELINEADIEDQFCQSYPKGREYRIPDSANQDPGRIRNEDFFKRMYGTTEAEVKSNLKELDWLPSITDVTLEVNTVNGCYDSLMAVSKELEKLDSTLFKYVSKTAGTFKWRTIAGTNRLSCHSFGIAIDINLSYSNYWKWDETTGNRRYKNKIPMEIVEIFENHGFIWGGKWFHYDTMHFEFRPELL